MHDAGLRDWAVAKATAGLRARGSSEEVEEVRAVGLGGRTTDPGYVPRWSVRCMDVQKE